MPPNPSKYTSGDPLRHQGDTMNTLYIDGHVSNDDGAGGAIGSRDPQGIKGYTYSRTLSMPPTP